MRVGKSWVPYGRCLAKDSTSTELPRPLRWSPSEKRGRPLRNAPQVAPGQTTGNGSHIVEPAKRADTSRMEARTGARICSTAARSTSNPGEQTGFLALNQSEHRNDGALNTGN